nr:reverse transcriptase domain-containing protein [Tanacetum cinerariifolium]
MEDEFYNLSVKGNDLKTYVRRFQELAGLCPNMVPNNEKLIKVFIGGLPRSIKGNVTGSKPQTLEEAINIAQRLMDQVTKHNSIQGTNNHKQKFEDKRNIFSNNNYRNNYQNIRNNHTNDFSQQQNRRQKLSDPMLLLQLRTVDILETIHCVRDVSYITQNLAQSGVETATRYWLSKDHAKIICDEKVVHIPIEDETLIIREPITDIKIHPKTKPVVITVYRGTDGRNFDVHKPFLFGAFALPAPEQASCQASGRKRKHMKLETETRISGLECNRALLENVPFVNNMVIEDSEYRIFFTNEFGDQAFQRWSDIDKVGIEALVSYLVVASM